jgi:hypothetical protein
VRARADEIMGNLGLRDRFKAVWRKRLARS